jgi:hypothetical protein
VWQIDLEPVGRIKLGDIGLQALGRPVFHRLAEFVLAIATRWARLTSEKPPVSTGSVS